MKRRVNIACVGSAHWRSPYLFVNRVVPFVLVLITVFHVTMTGDREDTVYHTESGYAEFTSYVPLHKFTGESEHLTGMIDPEENVVDFYLDLNTLKTGNGKRDRDMYRTLEVEEYPFAEFTGSLSSDFDPDSESEQDTEVTGEFSIHGVTREVTIQGSLQMINGEMHLKAEWILNLNDYDIEPPGILFYRVNEEQEIRIEATLNPRERESITNSE